MKIITANFYVGNKQPAKDINRLKASGAHAIGLQEAHTRFGAFRKHSGPAYWHLVNGLGGKGAKEVPVMLRKAETKYLGHGGYKASDYIPHRKGWSNERWIFYVMYEHEGVVYCIINTHTNAVVQRPDGRRRSLRLKRVREFRDHMHLLGQEITHRKNQGYVVIVTGDLNFRVTKHAWFWSPQRLFARNGMDFVRKGVNYIAWDASQLKCTKHWIIPKRKTGADHHWVVALLFPKN